MRDRLATTGIKVALLIGLSAAVAIVVTLGLATLAHEVLTRTIGQEAIQATDPGGIAFIVAAYATGGISAVAVFVVGWIRFIRGRR